MAGIDSKVTRKIGGMYPTMKSCCQYLFKGRSRSICVMLPAAVFLLVLLIFASGAGADERPDAGEDKTNSAPSDSTKDDLLLFWEEKELYVQTATRSEKPLSQVAENMTVITSRLWMRIPWPMSSVRFPGCLLILVDRTLLVRLK